MFQELGISLYCLNFGRMRGFFISGMALRRKLSKLEPAIIHTHGLRADRLSAQLPSQLCRVSTQRNIPEQDYPALYGHVLGSFIALLHRRALQRIPVVVACSSTIAQERNKWKSPSLIINNGVDLEICPQLPTAASRNSARASLGLSTSGLVFIYAGPLNKRKNPLFIIRSFQNWKNNANHQLMLVGAGPLQTHCREVTKNSRNIHVPGHRADLTPYFCSADVLISASRAEGFPNAVLEGLAFGLSVLLSDIPPHREIIESDTRIGRLFLLGQPESLITELDSFKPNGRNCLAARALVREKFSATAMSRKYEDLYTDIIGARLSRGPADIQVLRK